MKMRVAFTLVELLVVIAIIGVLVGLLLPAVQSAREAARRMQCSNNFKQLALALHNYGDTHRLFPPAGVTTNQLGWHVFILPFIEQGPLHNQFNFAEGQFNAGPGFRGPRKNELALNRIAAFLCPSCADELDGWEHPNALADGKVVFTTHYHGVMGPRGTNPFTGQTYRVLAQNVGNYGGYAQQGALTFPRPAKFGDFQDGTSNTFAIGETSWSLPGKRNLTWRAWIFGANGAFNDVEQNRAFPGSKNVFYPINSRITSTFNNTSFGSLHTGGAQFARADGSVHFVSQSIDQAIYLAAASRDGGEVVSLDQ